MQKLITCLAALTLAILVVSPMRLPAAEGYTNTPVIPGTSWHVHDPNRPIPRVVQPSEPFSLKTTAPSDAVILFDGKDFSKWVGEKGAVQWKIQDDYMETTKTGRIHTKDEFGDF